MLKFYIVYTAVMWVVAMVSGFLFGYSGVPAGQLWTQVAIIIAGYWVWKWVVARLIAESR